MLLECLNFLLRALFEVIVRVQNFLSYSSKAKGTDILKLLNRLQILTGTEQSRIVLVSGGLFSCWFVFVCVLRGYSCVSVAAEG